jgi:CBS domain containing-hemolysin-like protein
MVSDPLLVALSLALVLFNAFFTAAELAMVRVRATRIESLAEEGHWQARLVRAIQRRPDAFLSHQLGITLTSLGLGWVGEPAFAHLLAGAFVALGIESQTVVHNISFALAFVTITFLHIVVGELAPKSYAIRFTERVALWWRSRCAFSSSSSRPRSGSSSARRSGAEALRRHRRDERDLAHSEEELRLLLAESHRVGVLSARSASCSRTSSTIPSGPHAT